MKTLVTRAFVQRVAEAVEHGLELTSDVPLERNPFVTSAVAEHRMRLRSVGLKVVQEHWNEENAVYLVETPLEARYYLVVDWGGLWQTYDDMGRPRGGAARGTKAVQLLREVAGDGQVAAESVVRPANEVV